MDVIFGNFDRAIRTLEYARGLDEASDYDRFQIDSSLALYYTRMGDLAAAVGAEQTRLGSSYLSSLARTPGDAAASRGYLLLEVARNELALQDFAASAEAATAVLKLLDEGHWNTGFAVEQRAQALQIAELARQRTSVVPKAPQAPAPVVASADAASSVPDEELTRDCGQVVQAANDGTLEQLQVALSEITDPAVRAKLSESSPNESPAAARIDLFGDGHPVWVVPLSSGGTMGGSDLEVFDTDGAPIEIAAEAGANDNDDGLDPMLIELSGHYFVLARTGNRPLHLSAFTGNRVETIVCGFQWSETAVQTLRSATDAALCKAAMSGKLQYTPFDQEQPIDVDAVQASGFDQTFPGDKAALLDIDNDGQPRKVITLQFSSGGGRGCEISSLAVLDATGSTIDKALTDALQSPADCQGASQAPFLFDGKAYVESVSGADAVDGYRRIAQLNHGTLTSICDIEVNQQLALLDAVDELLQEAKNSQFSPTLNRYIMLKPGLHAVQVVLEASRRPDNPIPLVPEPSYNDSDGESILVSAIRARRYDVLSYLLDHGVDPNLPSHGLQFNPQVQPSTPIMIAVKSDDLKATQILLQHGASPDVAGEFGIHTLLGDAYAGASLPIFELLLDQGANPDQLNFDVSDLVQRKPEARLLPQKIDLLLRHGADADHWVHTLFNAIAQRSGLAVARHLDERDGIRYPETAEFAPVKTVWVENLLRNPTRASDNGLEPLLREALALRYLSSWVNTAAGSIQDQMRAPDAQSIRVMVGPRAGFESEAGPRPARGPQILERPCVGDLVCVLSADHPGSPRYLDPRHLAQLQLTEDQAFALGEANVRTKLRPVSALAAPTAEHPIQFLDYSPFESSRLVLGSDWTSLAARMGGELIAAIPAANLFVYARGGSPAAVHALREFAEAAYPSADRPLSTTVFRWTSRGWETVR